MTSFMKWMLPATAALGLVLGLALSTKAAEETQAKGSVTVTVNDKDGKAVEGADVMLVKPSQRQGKGKKAAEQAADNGKGKGKGMPEPIAQGQTDKEGKVTFKDVAVGEYRIFARKQGVGRSQTTPVTIEAGKTAAITVQLTEQGAGKGGKNR